MPTKKKSKSAAKKSTPKTIERDNNDKMFNAVLTSFRAAFPTPLDQRAELLAKVAGTVAAGLVTSPSPSIASPASMAVAAVDIAEEILKAAGIPGVDSSAEVPPQVADVEAAS